MSRVQLYTSRKVRVPAGRLSLVATVAVGLLSAVTQTAAAAPAAPSTVSVSPASPTTATAITVSWATRPDVAATHWQICPAADAQSAACRTGEVASPAQQGSIPTPDEGVFGVSLWFEGTDGSEGPKAAAGEQVIVDRTAPEQPVDVRYDGRTVSWQAPAGQVAPISRVHWKLCRGRNNPADDACASGTATGETFALPESTVPLGPDETSCDQVNSIVSVYLEDAAGNVSPANVISGGYSVAPGCIAPPHTASCRPHAGAGQAQGRPADCQCTLGQDEFYRWTQGHAGRCDRQGRGQHRSGSRARDGHAQGAQLRPDAHGDSQARRRGVQVDRAEGRPAFEGDGALRRVQGLHARVEDARLSRAHELRAGPKAAGGPGRAERAAGPRRS